MSETVNATVIVSGPPEETLLQTLCQCVTQGERAGVSVKPLYRQTAASEEEPCMVDLLQITCPPTPESFEMVASRLQQAAADKVFGAPVPPLRLRVVHSYSLALTTPSLAEELWSLYDRENSQASHLDPVREVELDILTRCGRKGRDEFIRRMEEGQDLTIELVQRIIEENGHPASEHPVDFAF